MFILSCQGQYALQKREETGLLAGLWQFPNVAGKLETAQALEEVEKMGLAPVELYRQVERKHIFTHIQWQMRGLYLEVRECRNCGHIMVGTEAPEVCPTCDHPRSYFEVHAENY